MGPAVSLLNTQRFLINVGFREARLRAGATGKGTFRLVALVSGQPLAYRIEQNNRLVIPS